MSKALLPLLLAPLCFSLWGCATTMSLSEDQKVFGGVRWDAQLIHAAFNVPEPGPNGEPPGMGYSIAIGLLPLVVLDVPLSLVADTVVLPVTGTLAITRSGEDEADVEDVGIAPSTD